MFLELPILHGQACSLDHTFVEGPSICAGFIQVRQYFNAQCYKKITMIGLTADMNIKKRRDLLKKFDKT